MFELCGGVASHECVARQPVRCGQVRCGLLYMSVACTEPSLLVRTLPLIKITTQTNFKIFKSNECCLCRVCINIKFWFQYTSPSNNRAFHWGPDAVLRPAWREQTNIHTTTHTLIDAMQCQDQPGGSKATHLPSNTTQHMHTFTELCNVRKTSQERTEQHTSQETTHTFIDVMQCKEDQPSNTTHTHFYYIIQHKEDSQVTLHNTHFYCHPA